MMTLETLRKLATITVEALPMDDVRPEDHFDVRPEDHFDVNDSNPKVREANIAMIAEIKHRLDRGDQWAWCYVVVRATFDGHEAWTGLGACSYANEHEFRDEGACGYFSDMCTEALSKLLEKLHKAERAQQSIRLTSEIIRAIARSAHQRDDRNLEALCFISLDEHATSDSIYANLTCTEARHELARLLESAQWLENSRD